MPALSGVFKFGDQVLRIDNKQVLTADDAHRAIDLFMGSNEVRGLEYGICCMPGACAAWLSGCSEPPFFVLALVFVYASICASGITIRRNT